MMVLNKEWSIPFYYDPMIAKLICHAETREMAIEKTIRAINEYEITGLETTLGFCNFVMHHEAFRSGKFDTGFVTKYFKPEVLTGTPDADEEKIAAALSSYLLSTTNTSTTTTPDTVNAPVSKWKKNRV
jgi:acetyl-CoA carboxylase biotin carboxylase subunit